MADQDQDQNKKFIEALNYLGHPSEIGLPGSRDIGDVGAPPALPSAPGVGGAAGAMPGGGPGAADAASAAVKGKGGDLSGIQAGLSAGSKLSSLLQQMLGSKGTGRTEDAFQLQRSGERGFFSTAPGAPIPSEGPTPAPAPSGGLDLLATTGGGRQAAIDEILKNLSTGAFDPGILDNLASILENPALTFPGGGAAEPAAAGTAGAASAGAEGAAEGAGAAVGAADTGFSAIGAGLGALGGLAGIFGGGNPAQTIPVAVIDAILSGVGAGILTPAVGPFVEGITQLLGPGTYTPYISHRLDAGEQIKQVPDQFAGLLEQPDRGSRDAFLNKLSTDLQQKGYRIRFDPKTYTYSGGYEQGDQAWATINPQIQQIVQLQNAAFDAQDRGDPAAQVFLQALAQKGRELTAAVHPPPTEEQQRLQAFQEEFPAFGSPGGP